MKKNLIYLSFIISIFSFYASFVYNGANEINLTNRISGWSGEGPNGETNGSSLNYTRIPSLIITNDNKILTFFDLRWEDANDQRRADTGIMISEDGGENWTKKTPFRFKESSDNNRRFLDPTVLYDHLKDEIYILNGVWSSGNRNWYQDRERYYNSDIWSAQIHKSIDGGKTWELNAKFSKNENTDSFNKTSKDAENNIRGFLGGLVQV